MTMPCRKPAFRGPSSTECPSIPLDAISTCDGNATFQSVYIHTQHTSAMRKSWYGRAGSALYTRDSTRILSPIERQAMKSVILQEEIILTILNI